MNNKSNIITMEILDELKLSEYSQEVLDKHNLDVITWPDVQYIMDLPGFNENSILIDDEVGYDIFGSSAYLVNNQWYKIDTNL